MARFIISGFLGLIGGYFGLLVASGFYEIVWGVGVLGIWIFRKSFYWFSDYFIIVPIFGGILGGTASENWWGPFIGGFFLTIFGFYLFVFLLNVPF
jgi:hypothetical protein